MGEDHVIGLAKNWKVSSLSCCSSTLIADCENCERGLGSMITKLILENIMILVALGDSHVHGCKDVNAL